MSIHFKIFSTTKDNKAIGGMTPYQMHNIVSGTKKYISTSGEPQCFQVALMAAKRHLKMLRQSLVKII